MADSQSDNVNSRLQVSEQEDATARLANAADDCGLPQLHYADFLRSIAAMRALNDDETEAAEEKRDIIADETRTAFDNLMECPAGSLVSILLKIKAAQLQAFNTMEGSNVSPRVYGELLGIIAADLEVVVQMRPEMRGGVGRLDTVDGGKAVQS
jgi:hypothetical protein